MNHRLPTCTPDEQSSRLSGVKPLFRALTALNGFQVEPGANWPCVARPSSGLPARSEYSALSCFLLTPPTQTEGSYVGWLAIATIRPVSASITTTAPESAS